MASSTLAIARALTKRTKRSQSNAGLLPTREGRYAPGTINRELISLPTEFISTTNVNALNYPDISTLSAKSSNSSINSANDSDFSHISRNFIDSPLTTPETSSIESSPLTSGRGNFFDAIPKPAATSAGRPATSGSTGIEVPAVPKRAPSHSKKAHQDLARKLSVQRMSPPPTALAGPTNVSKSAEIFMGSSEPFSKELEQANEVAEEFGLVAASLIQEERDLLHRGLMKFDVNDYLDEISAPSGGVFEGKVGPMAKPWI